MSPMESLRLRAWYAGWLFGLRLQASIRAVRRLTVHDAAPSREG